MTSRFFLRGPVLGHFWAFLVKHHFCHKTGYFRLLGWSLKAQVVTKREIKALRPYWSGYHTNFRSPKPSGAYFVG